MRSSVVHGDGESRSPGPVDYRCLRPLHSVLGALVCTIQCQGAMRFAGDRLRCDACSRECALEPVAVD